MDPIALLRSRYDTLTNAEQKLADYIISNPRCMLEGRMSQLSKNAGSSNAALARLCQKLGYDGFSEFRFSMNNYLLSQGGDRNGAGQKSGRMGIFNKCTDDWIVMTDDAEVLDKDDLCIVLSMAGRGFREKEHILENLKAHNCSLMLITMNNKMHIAQLADEVLLLPRVTDDSQDNFFEDQIVVYVMLELLLYEVASLKVNQHKEEPQR